MNELVSPKQAAKMFGVSTTTLRNWEVLGKIQSIKTLGGHRRYNLKEIKSLLNDDKNNVKI